MKRAVFITLLLTLSLSFVQLFAQSSCATAEREMERYFQVYQPGESPQMSWIEKAWRQCPQRNTNVRLLYHYFKAMESLYAGNVLTLNGYRNASYHYDMLLEDIAFLERARGANPYFTELYGRRVNALAKTLAAQAQVLGQQESFQAPSLTNEEPTFIWEKESPSFAESQAPTGNRYRAADKPQEESFDKRFHYEGTYRQENPWGDQLDAYDQWLAQQNGGREPYGVVGQLEDLDLRAYLQFRGARGEAATFASIQTATTTTRGMDYGADRGAAAPRSTSQASTLSYDEFALTYASPSNGTTRSISRNAPAAWVNSLGVNYIPAANIYEPSMLKSEPSTSAANLGFIPFGETLALMNQGRGVVAAGMAFVQVRTRDGQVGWVEEMAVVEQGRMAAVLRKTNGYRSPNSQNGPISLEAGQAVVLAETQGNWVKVYDANGEHEIWLPSVDALSIEPIDIALAEGLLEANRMPTDDRKREILNSLRGLNGYSASPLAELVEAQIR